MAAPTKPIRREDERAWLQRTWNASWKSVAVVVGQKPLDQPGKLHRRKGQGRYGDGRDGRARRTRPGAEVEDLAVGPHRARRNAGAGGDRRLGRDPADLDDSNWPLAL